MGKYENGEYKHWSPHNNRADCELRGGEWMEFHNFLERAPQHTTKEECVGASDEHVKYIWGRPMGDPVLQCLVALHEPECVEAPWSRPNHLGNTKSTGEPVNYEWKLPHFPSGISQRCVLRVRCVNLN